MQSFPQFRSFYYVENDFLKTLRPASYVQPVLRLSTYGGRQTDNRVWGVLITVNRLYDPSQESSRLFPGSIGQDCINSFFRLSLPKQFKGLGKLLFYCF